jgi:hypothetical protein
MDASGATEMLAHVMMANGGYAYAETDASQVQEWASDLGLQWSSSRIDMRFCTVWRTGEIEFSVIVTAEEFTALRCLLPFMPSATAFLSNALSRCSREVVLQLCGPVVASSIDPSDEDALDENVCKAWVAWKFPCASTGNSKRPRTW